MQSQIVRHRSRRRGLVACRALPSRRPIRCRPGTTAPAKKAILDFVARTHDGRRRRISCRPTSASPPSTTTARCGPSSRSTSSSPSPSTGSRRWRRSIRSGRTSEPFKSRARRRPDGARGERREGPARDHGRDPCRHDRRRNSPRPSRTGSRRRGIRASTGPTPSSSTSRCSSCWRYPARQRFKTFIVSGGGIEFMRPLDRAGLRHPAGAGRRLLRRRRSSSCATASRC